MGRKRKQVDPGLVTNLPPCRVCGAPGAGLHYGVNTCEACKGFFHRSLKIWTQYKCDQTGVCAVEPGRKKLCQLCRYNRCLAVGMAKEAIKTGRYTSLKRTNDILEIKELQEKQTISTESVDNQIPEHLTPAGTFHTMTDEHSLDSDSHLDKFSSLCGNASDQLFSACVLNFSPDSLIHCEQSHLTAAPSLKLKSGLLEAKTDSICGFVDTETDSNCGCFKTKTDRQRPQDCATNKLQRTHLDNTSLHDIESFISNDKHGFHQLQSQQQQFLSCTSLLTPLSITSPDDTAKASSPMLHEAGLIPLTSCSTAVTSPAEISRDSLPILESELMSFTPCSFAAAEPISSVYNIYTATSLHSPLGTSTSSQQLSLLSSVLTASPSTSHSVTSSLLQADAFDSTSDECDGCFFGSGVEFVSEIYSDKDLIIRRLLKADEHSLIPLFGQMTDEEIQQQQLEHLESCRLKTEMFGQLPRLPDHEYDYIFVTTGLDTDDRQKLLNSMGDNLEKMIRAMVKFCKAIPGFSKLDISDRIKLIKYSRQEFYIFITYKCVDPVKKILRGFDFQWKCENELLKTPTATETRIYEDTLNAYFKFCQSLQSLKLSYEELVVIRALIVMCPDRDKPVSSALAHEIHWQLSLCLIHILSQRYPNPLFIFARIMDRLTEARTQTEGVIFCLKRLKLDKYSHLMYNPLLKEMFGGIFFNNDEDD